jgi:hypothetical protein
MSLSEIPDLVGKVIAVKYGSGNRDFACIQVLNFALQAGRRFLVGKTVKTKFDETEGIRFSVAWDVVTSYSEFDSLEHCQKCIDSWYPPETKPGFWSHRN